MKCLLMKKILTLVAMTVLFAVFMSPAVFAAEKGDYVFDETGTLTNSQIAALNEKAAKLWEKRECGVYIYIVDLVPEEYARTIDNMEIYTQAFFDRNNLGYGDKKNGIVLLLEIGDVPGERDYLFFTNGDCTSVFGDSTRETLLDDHIVPLFRDAFSNGNFYKVADTFLDEVESTYVINTVVKWILRIVVVILVPMLIAWIVCSGWKRKMKTAVIARTADNYIPADGFNLTGQEDKFLYRTTVRRKVPKSSSSSGGSSSSSSSGSSSGGKV